MKKALIVHGGWDGHHPQHGAELFGGLLRESGFEVTIRDSLDAYLDSELLGGLDLVMQHWTMGKITREQFLGLQNAVEAGCGLGGFHGGLCDAFRENADYQFMTGGQFVAHPGNLIDYQVDVVARNHPITEGISSFKMHSEQYYMHYDPAVEVLATTTFSGEHRAETKGVVMPVVWTKTWGKGKVFFCALGHNPDDLAVPECRKIIHRGLLWAAK